MISVIIASYGDADKWNALARRAIRSVLSQDRQAREIIRHHSIIGSIAKARNDAAQRSSGEWLCFLDCDDELEPGYISSMEDMISKLGAPNHLLYPAVRYIRPDQSPPTSPIMLEKKPITKGNYMVIGTIIHRNIFMKLGGFHELEAYEDWDLWMRAIIYDACIPVPVPSSIYRIHFNPNGRNMISDPQRIVAQILSKNRRDK